MIGRSTSSNLGHEDAIAAEAMSLAKAATKTLVPRWKRLLDLSIAWPLLVLLAPAMLVAAGLVRLSGPGPVLFKQMRVGLGGEPFAMLKLRTMYHDRTTDENDREAIARELRGEATPSAVSSLFRPERDARITPVGAVLRKFSIDELPQLINVIRGQMSIVGPRPALPWEVEMFTPEQRRRHDCSPGITGLWQVSGRNRLSSLEMLILDRTYVEHQSLLLDLSIIVRTPAAVLFHRNTR
jgi:lipopolysaccharide/colanic/teichoic acid biosynthesis glycosyltransferase